jgi:signal transduction histidine kinase
MVGANWWSILPLEDRDRLRADVTANLSRGETTEFNFASRDEHGENRRLAAIVTPILTSGGERVGQLAVIRDISNRVRLQRQLEQKSKMASLGEMAGALSHHFNNILGGVVTSVDFALASRDPDIVMRVMEKTAHALTRATELVDSLLAFAEGDFRDANLGDLGEVVIELVRRLEARLADSSVRIEVDLQSLPIVEVPRTAMLTVLRNLAENAIEAMPEGGVLRVATRLEDHWIAVSVGDTGCGLDEDAIARIFEPFFTTKLAGTQAAGMNRGLGLAVAHGILKVLHGHIQVNSTVGAGTEFVIRLPREAVLTGD